MSMMERTQLTSTVRPVEELHIRKPGVYVSLVVNRRHRVARVVDFLAGNFLQKMQAINAAALKEGIARVYTLVEREESLGWMKVGYAREGAIPAYYKRSDAYMMGHLVSANPVLTDEGVPEAPVADAARAEKVLTQARKIVDASTAPKGMRTEVLDDTVAAIRWAGPKGKPPAWLADRFGRTGQRFHVCAKPARPTPKSPEAIVSVELQETFGNAYLQPAVWATKPDEAPSLIAALNALNEILRTREITCAFGLTPADNPIVAGAMLAAGYRKTGLVARHLVVNDKRVDALLWARRPVEVS
jgi:hypothetical protein